MIGKYNSEIVNSIYPEATMFEAMRIWSLPKGKEHLLSEKCSSGEYFGQIKKDGFWYQFNRTENYSYLFSRNESRDTGLLTEKIDNVPHLKQALEVLPKNTILIGEIYVPGGTSKDTTRIMGCLPATAIKRQKEEGLIHYYIHDIIAFNGVSMLNMPAMKRYEVLVKVIETFNLLQYDFIELAIAYTDDLYSRIGTALENGEEGMVLKNKTSPYTPGKKPAWSAIKCKQVDFADVVCMGFEDATKVYDGKEIETWQYWEIEKEIETGKWARHSLLHGDPGDYLDNPEYKITPITKPYYFGWKTSIVIGAYDNNGNLKKIGTVSSGLTDDMKKDITENSDKFIGSVLMVQCMQKDNDAKTLRHPIFKSFRIDKNAKECTLEDIF